MKTSNICPSLFDDFFENEAIDRIRRFAALAKKMGFVPVCQFSGGKDSQVCYDLCRRAGIEFRVVFNHCFESAVTLNFIRTQYPEVEWRREVKQGFFQNIKQNHGGLLPTVEFAYCCEDYKHNRRYVDAASIVGVRKAESIKRAQRKVLETKNKTVLKKNAATIGDYFSAGCVASGASSEIQLKPIVDWSETDVWNYIRRHNLPINPEYKFCRRVGCVVCPKANITHNYRALMAQPKLIDAVIKARNGYGDWIINSENKDYADNKAEYVCRWLNHSFRPFTKKQRELADKVIENYNTKC